MARIKNGPGGEDRQVLAKSSVSVGAGVETLGIDPRTDADNTPDSLNIEITGPTVGTIVVLGYFENGVAFSLGTIDFAANNVLNVGNNGVKLIDLSSPTGLDASYDWTITGIVGS